MDKLNLSGQTDFALTTDALAFMQSAYGALEKLGAMGGENFIVSGCTVSGSTATSGWMFLKGKLMPFQGGSIQTNVRIIEETNTITVDVASREQTTLRAEFGTSSDSTKNVEWSSIKRAERLVDAFLIRESVTNLNNATKEGVYKVSSADENSPGSGTMLVFGSEATDLIQLFASYSSFQMRVRDGEPSWSDWRMVWQRSITSENASYIHPNINPVGSGEFDSKISIRKYGNTVDVWMYLYGSDVPVSEEGWNSEPVVTLPSGFRPPREIGVTDGFFFNRKARLDANGDVIFDIENFGNGTGPIHFNFMI